MVMRKPKSGAERVALVGGMLLILLACRFAGMLPAPAHAQDASSSVTLTLRGDEPADAVRRMVDALSADGRKVEIRIAGEQAAPPAAAPAKPAKEPATNPAAAAKSTLALEEGQAEMLWDQFIGGFDYGNAAIPKVVELPGNWERSWAQNRNERPGWPAWMRLLAALAIGLAAAGTFRLATARWFAARSKPREPTFAANLIAASFALLQDAVTILVALAVIRWLRNAWLPNEDLAFIALRTLAHGLAIGAAYLAVGRFLLSPGMPQRRLMPLPRAGRHFRILVVYSVMTLVFMVAAVLAQQVSGGPEPLAGLLAITGLLTVVFKLWWFFDMRRDLSALILSASSQPSPLLRLLAVAAPWFYLAAALLTWMIGRAAGMMSNGARWAGAAEITQIVIVLVPILAIGVTHVLRCRFEAHPDAQGHTPLARATGVALQAGAGGLVWAGGFYLLARLWAGLLLGMDTAQLGAISRQAAGVAALAFIGWVLLVFLRAFFDAYAPRRRVAGPLDEDAPAEEGVPTRLATVLPVLRGVVLGAVVGLTILVVLARLGVDIGPLLAGFGILGLAISFGSQALVRDIVSGVFFMLEDAFRVGEYVDTGRLKGTVEKISLRSMQLRHQSGQIHTVPFGQIQQLTNASRDWATVKFNVRLDHSADLEQARKAIKKTGIALMEDPEYGPHFIAPLKMQGVADITDTAIVIRLKFTGKPNQASMLQREALKRVYRALNEARIPFASNAVTVRGGEAGPPPSGAAAAISAVAPPTPLVPGG